jgi:LemA protein
MAAALARFVWGLMLAATLVGCGVLDEAPRLEERARAAWSEVRNQYQRRADLVPSLVEIVKSQAGQEREILGQVTEARARLAQTRADAATITDPPAFKAYQEAQDQMSGALGRLFATVERYLELKTSSAFTSLRAQLDQTENRIVVARRDYAEAAAAYNRAIGTAPGRWIAAILHPDAKPMALFTPPTGAEPAADAK